MQAIEMSCRLRERGHAVWLAVPPGSRIHAAAHQQELPTLPAPESGYIHPFITLRLSRFLRQARIQIIHCQHSRDLAVMVPAAQIADRTLPVVLSKRVGSYISKRDPFHRYTYSRVRCVLAISSVIAENVLATTPLPRDRVSILHDAVNLRVFDPSRIDGGRIRREFGIPDDMPLIGFVGRFSPGKGHEELLEAVALLQTRGLHFHTLVVGEPSLGEEAYANEVRRMAHQRVLPGSLTFAGYRSDIPELMASFDVLAFPSHAESFGVVLIEAMAMGKAVVSTDCDGVLDIVVDGETGIMVPARDGPALGRGLERLLRNRELRMGMGVAGRKRVELLFDQEVQITRLETVYTAVLSGEPEVHE